MELTIECMRRMGGLDPDVVSDEEAQGWLNAAKAWYTDADVHEVSAGDLYAFWVLTLACWLYDHRGSGDLVPQKFVLSVHSMRGGAGRG